MIICRRKMKFPSQVWNDNESVATHRIGVDDCGEFRYDAEADDAWCDECGTQLGQNELYEIARVNY